MITKIFVAGAGLMGGGIAQVCAQAGYEVTIRDLTGELIEKGLKSVRWSVGKFVEKGKVQGSVDEIMGRITGTTDLAAAASADFV
ncbi:MAG: 3-hydroxybutyryl-CoA dehydrogenase, partial [Deltaproteobacteria bacterium]|nr:3-hydroxybutyryl-CoA dehydrogenase [Deltaproteobacteria bacterium]